jgi:hypothetical protein
MNIAVLTSGRGSNLHRFSPIPDTQVLVFFTY